LPGEPKNTEDSILYNYFKAFSSKEFLLEVEKMFFDGKGWGDLKKELFTLVDKELKIYREKYYYYLDNSNEVEKILIDGENKVSSIAEKKLSEIRKKVGIRALDEK
jgi:tryptophanyl-tRNA synthetase